MEWKTENNCYRVKTAEFEFAIKCSFSKINSTFSCRALLKGVLKNFKRMLLLHPFDEFFCFLNWFFKVFLLKWFRNLKAEFGLYRKRAGVRTPLDSTPRCVPAIISPLYQYVSMSVGKHIFSKSAHRISLKLLVKLGWLTGKKLTEARLLGKKCHFGDNAPNPPQNRGFFGFWKKNPIDE